MGGHWLIALLALPGACQEPPSYQQKLERARHRIAQLERVVGQLRSELDGLRPPFAALWHARGVAARQATTCGTPAMRAVLDDLFLLAACDGFVGKFTSNIDRLAVALSNAWRGGDCVTPFESLDAAWCADFGRRTGKSIHGDFMC